MLNEKGINPSIFNNNPTILIINYALLETNLNYLIDYNLLTSLKTTDNYNFLLESNLMEKIDKIIELGLYNFLEQDLDILNIPFDLLDRIELLNALDMPVTNIEDFWSIIESETFIVPDQDIKNYIPNITSLMPKKDLPLDKLNNFKSDNISLIIGNTIFSIPKIKRKITEGFTLYDALFYQKKVNLTTYRNITNSFKEITK